jgi:hypothetical protein
VPGTGPGPALGQVLLACNEAADAPEWRRLAWTSPVTGRHLLVNRQGARQALLTAAEFDQAVATGTLVPRSPHGHVEAVLLELAGEPAQPGDGIAQAPGIR